MQPRLFATIALGLVFLAGCARRAKKDPVATNQDAGAAPVAVAAAAAAAAASGPVEDAQPAGPRRLTYGIVVATFDKRDVLDECTSFDFEITPPEDAGVDWKPQEDPIEAVRKSLAKRGTEIKGSCEENFADVTPLANCVATNESVDKKTGALATITLKGVYYNYGTIGTTDTYRKNCLEMGGKWTAVDRTSLVWMHAKHEHERKKLMKALNE